jgi:signal transduction histidine kinase
MRFRIRNLKQYLPYFTGESVIPLKLYVVSLPAIIFFTIVIEVDLNDTNNLFSWALATFYSILVTTIFIFFYKYVVFSYAKHIAIPLNQVLIYAVLLGSVKGISTYYFSVILKLQDHGFIDIDILDRLIPAIVISVWYVPVISWIHFSLDRYEKVRVELMNKAAKLQVENQGYKDLIESSKLTLRSRMNEIFVEIKNELDKLKTKNNFEEEWPKISKLVRDAAIQEIRPQSRKLWVNQSQNYKSFKLRDFVLSAIQINPFPWKIVIPIYISTSFYQVFQYDSQGSVLFVLSHALIIFMMFQIGTFIKSNIKDKFLLSYLLIFAMTAVLLYFGSLIIRDYSGIKINPTLTIIGIIWLFMITIVCSLLTTVKKTKDQILDEINDKLNEQQVHRSTLAQLEKQVNIKLAKYLHGYVQARLMSNSLQLEIASKNHDSELAMKELEKLSKDLVEEYGIMDQLQTNTTFAEEIEKIVKSWQGICEIKFKGYSGLKIDQLIIRDFIEDAISESIANSVRHGLADSIDIEFQSIQNESFEIRVTDNGVGPISSTPGMGSEIFNLLCGDKWRLTKNDGGKGSILILPINNLISSFSTEGVKNI